MNREFTVGRRARKEENIPNNYEIINLNTYRPKKPIVLVLGGNGTTDDRAANGNAKIVGSWLGTFNEDVDLLSVNYNQALSEPFMTTNCLELVQKLLIPYVSDNGKRIDVDTACKNMRNVTIMAHCRGVDGMMKRIALILKFELENLQYTEQEQEKIISQVVLVAYGSHYKDDVKGMKGLYCLSFADEMFELATKKLAKQFVLKSDLINMVKSDRDLFKSIDTSQKAGDIWNDVTSVLYNRKRVFNLKEKHEEKIRLFAFGLYHTDGFIWEQDHALDGLTRNEDWSSSKIASSTGDCVSRCFACVLCNSVANSIQNNQADKLIEFDMNKLQEQIETICKTHNFEQSKLDDMALDL